MVWGGSSLSWRRLLHLLFYQLSSLYADDSPLLLSPPSSNSAVNYRCCFDALELQPLPVVCPSFCPALMNSFGKEVLTQL